jgi:DNA polymerase-4
MTTLCRQCGHIEAVMTKGRCPVCRSPRRIQHPELAELSIAHIDCDAFYATIEKRDNPELADKPVIIGGGRRGVVSTACYVARRFGVRSAMPMFKALKACPDAIVIRPDMAKYSEIGRQIRTILETATPLVEPLSIDEAFLDLTGSTRLFGKPPAAVLADLVLRIERDIGVTASIGLSYAKFLAKIASDMDKPRGFAVIGREEAKDLVAALPVSRLPGVGKKFTESLGKAGFRTIADLAKQPPGSLQIRFGASGARLEAFAQAEDPRKVNPKRPTKSVSSETTLIVDLSEAEDLKPILWRQAERVAARLKAKDFAAGSVVLKLKTDHFQSLTRQRVAEPPTQLAERLYQIAEPMLLAELGGRKFRLIGLGTNDLKASDGADRDDLLAAAAPGVSTKQQVKLEAAMAAIRAKDGEKAIYKGRAIRPGNQQSGKGNGSKR